MTLTRARNALLTLAFGLCALPLAAQEGPGLTEIVEAWLSSPHGDRGAESFIHWNEEGEVPVACATCHSGPGFVDFIGGDGSAAGVVDHPAPIAAPVDCATCHNATATALDTVVFPSGESVSGLGSSAVCVVCHQGRASTDSVDAALAGAQEDTVNPDLAFLNVHYRAAAATLMGGAVRGGYQYEGKSYVGPFAHVPPLNTCTACHQPHTTEVALAPCAACHTGIETLRDIRITPVDFDGDGDVSTGIHAEIVALHVALGAAIQAYAAEVSDLAIVYDAAAFPYFFADTDGNGAVTPGEAAFPNRYRAWTPRLLKAAYNYQFVAKDPGGYSHNPKYIIQLLHDSLESLGARVDVDMSGMIRP